MVDMLPLPYSNFHLQFTTDNPSTSKTTIGRRRNLKIKKPKFCQICEMKARTRHFGVITCDAW